MALETNLAALMRDGAFTVKAVIVHDIPEPAAIAATTAVDDAIPLTPAAPSVGNAAPSKATAAYTVTAAAAVAPKSLLSGESWTFVALDSNIQVGDYALASTRKGICMVQITQRDDEVMIEPGDTIKYSYIAQRIDLSQYIEDMDKNRQIETLHRSAYQNNVRQSFKQTMMAALDDDTKSQLQRLLK